MKILDCPSTVRGRCRSFTSAAKCATMPDPSGSDDDQWADYVFNRRGEPGIKREWWYHVPSGTWFIAERDNRPIEFCAPFFTVRRAADAADDCRPSHGEWIDRSQTVSLSIRRDDVPRLCAATCSRAHCGPTTCDCWGAASSIIDRAASTASPATM